MRGPLRMILKRGMLRKVLHNGVVCVIFHMPSWLSDRRQSRLDFSVLPRPSTWLPCLQKNHSPHQPTWCKAHATHAGDWTASLCLAQGVPAATSHSPTCLMNVVRRQHIRLETPCAAVQLSGGFTLNLHRAYWRCQGLELANKRCRAGSLVQLNAAYRSGFFDQLSCFSDVACKNVPLLHSRKAKDAHCHLEQAG